MTKFGWLKVIQLYNVSSVTNNFLRNRYTKFDSCVHTLLSSVVCVETKMTLFELTQFITVISTKFKCVLCWYAEFNKHA